MKFLKTKQEKITFWLSFLALVFFLLDRLLKKIALQGVISFSPNPNLALGIPCPDFIFYPLFLFVFYFLSQGLVNFWQKKKSREFFALFLILSGAFSNFLDRIYYAYVIDYFDFFSFTLINLADLMIVFGVFILTFCFFRKA
ncbi:signal peptidase II [Patescibacteria group bacterium]|nr:signal peptidase II [Patescibacteria group bacterium]